MLITRFHNFLISPLEKTPKSRQIFWLTLSLTLATIYAITGFMEAFATPYVVQDDARQHVFWMMRFVDPDLFPNDLIADYFQSVAPAGYTTLYKIAAMAGLNPLLFHKLLPLGLGLISTYYCFQLSLELFPLPFTGFIASLLLNQSLWITDDLASTTPRAFVYPFFLAFLYYLVKRSLLFCLTTIALVGLFYPQYIFVASGILILRLFDWQDGKLGLSKDRTHYLFCGAGLLVTFVVLLPFALSTSKFGPTLTVEEARQLPEFFPGGRSTFFHVHPKNFWLTGKRSGMFPKSLFTPATHCAGLLFPLFLALPKIFPLAQSITRHIWLLLQMFLASATLFFIAHIVLFKLHLPSRYTAQTLRLIIVLITAIVLTLLIDKLLKIALASDAKNALKQFGSLGLTAIIAILLLGYPAFVPDFPKVGYKEGRMPDLYEFLQQQPKDSVIASISEEANNIPTFSQRSILSGREYGIPYQVGYYRQYRQRTNEMIRALYSPDLNVVKTFIQNYRVNLWLLDRGSLTLEYVEKYGWLKNFDATAEVINNLKQGKPSVIARSIDSCSVFQNKSLIVLHSDCILKQEAN